METLYKHTKTKIISKLVDYTFEKETTADIIEEIRLFWLSYTDLIPEDTHKILVSLPPGIVPETDNLYVAAGGYKVDLYLTRNRDDRENGPKARIPFSYRSWDHNGQNIIKNPILITQLQKYAQEKENLAEKKRDFKYSIQSTIYSFRYVEKFQTAFPDWKDFLGEDFFGPKNIQSTALTISPQEIMCKVAKFRGDTRDGCCDGEVVIAL